MFILHSPFRLPPPAKAAVRKEVAAVEPESASSSQVRAQAGAQEEGKAQEA
jgi:hypothetical protein